MQFIAVICISILSAQTLCSKVTEQAAGLDKLKDIREGNENLLIFFHGENQDISDFQKLREYLRKQKMEIKMSAVQDQQRSGLFLLRGQSLVEYEGVKTHEYIADWVLRKQGAVSINKKSTLKRLIEKERSVLVGFFKTPDSPQAKAFDDFAVNTEDIHCYAVNNLELIKEYRQVDGTVLLMKSFDEKEMVFMDEINQENLSAFIQKENVPLVVDFSQQNARLAMGSGPRVHFLLVSSSEDSEHFSRIHMMKLIAKNYREEILFVHVDLNIENHSLLSLLSVSGDDVPAMYLVNLETGDRYLARGEISVTSMNTFIKGYKAKELKKSLRTAKSPEKEGEKEEAVKTLVNLNFGEYIGGDGYLFIMLYTPWSEACKLASQVWKELAQEFKSHQNTTMAKMDVVGNEMLDLSVVDYPTIAWAHPNTKHIHFYEGSLDIKSLRSFIKSGGSEINADLEEESDDAVTADAVGEDDDDDDLGEHIGAGTTFEKQKHLIEKQLNERKGKEIGVEQTDVEQESSITKDEL